MNNVIINFKTDKDTKKQLQDFAEQIGVSVSTILNAQIKQIVLQKRFAVSSEPSINNKTLNEVIEAAADYRAGKNISRKLKSGSEVRSYLEKL